MVATNGDSLINLFYGGRHGLALVDSISLAGAGRPTDLVVSGTPGPGLRFFVSTEGQGRVFAVSFSSATGTVALMPILSSSAAGSGFTPRETAASAWPGVILAGATANGGNPQSQGAAQGSTQSVAATGVAGQLAAVLGMMSQAIQPLLLPSFRALTWFIDNLVQKGQAETSDILPLGEGDMASVAVILAASSMLDPTETDADPPSTAQIEGQDPAGPATDMSSPDAREPAPPVSTLERFLFHPDGSFAGSSVEGGRAARLPAGIGAEWVWRERGAGTSVRGPEPDHSTIDAAGPGLRLPASRSIAKAEAPVPVGSTTGLGTLDQVARPAGSAEMELPSTYRMTIPAALMLLSTAILFATKYGKKAWTIAKGGVWRLRLAKVTPTARKAVGRGKSPRSPSRTIQDLPPWIQISVEQRSRSKPLREPLSLPRKPSSRDGASHGSDRRAGAAAVADTSHRIP